MRKRDIYFIKLFINNKLKANEQAEKSSHGRGFLEGRHAAPDLDTQYLRAISELRRDLAFGSM
jgi:hypothetical protein